MIDHDNEARLAAMAEKGQSPLLVAVDGRLKAIAAIGDRVRPEASQVLARLAKAGWEIHVLSGDHPRIVQQLASKLSLDLTHCMGGVSPEGKLERVREFQRGGGWVIMVGDGVNDAAALAPLMSALLCVVELKPACKRPMSTWPTDRWKALRRSCVPRGGH